MSKFSQCNNLDEIPEDLFKNCTNVEYFNSTFYGCTNIKTIPENLFRYNINATSFNHTFGSTSIKSIPENLFTTNNNINNISYAFKSCNQLTTIPQSIINKALSISSHNQTFRDCTSASNYSTLPAELK